MVNCNKINNWKENLLLSNIYARLPFFFQVDRPCLTYTPQICNDPLFRDQNNRVQVITCSDETVNGQRGFACYVFGSDGLVWEPFSKFKLT